MRCIPGFLERVISFLKTPTTRDSQSQIIRKGKGDQELFVIRGARMGLPAYDVASILWEARTTGLRMI